MATTPPTYLLDRQVSTEWVREAISVASPLLQEIVNYGLAAFRRCAHRLSDHDLAILLPYRHLLEMIDGVEVLVSQAASSPAQLQLRSAFEALLTIKYIVQDDTERRAFAYLAGETQRHLKRLCAIRRLPDIGVSEEQIDAQIARVHNLLHRPGWKDAAEALFLVSQRGRLAEWFRAYGGPSNRADLASRVGQTKEYNILYRQWADAAHVLDVVRQVSPGPSQSIVFRRIRETDDLSNVVGFAVCMSIEATRAILRHYRPEEESAFDGWYRESVSPHYRRF